MNDTDWTERLEALADREDAHLFDVARRRRARPVEAAAQPGRRGRCRGSGRCGRARHRIGPGAGSSGRAVPAPVGEGPTAAATYHEPETTLSPSAPPAAHEVRAGRLPPEAADGAWKGAGDIPFKAWRNDLYATARSVLDPSGTHLTYSSRGLTSGSDGHGVGLGIKLGWSEPGRSGEGMVQVTVTSEGGSDDEQCSTTGRASAAPTPCWSVGRP